MRRLRRLASRPFLLFVLFLCLLVLVGKVEAQAPNPRPPPRTTDAPSPEPTNTGTSETTSQETEQPTGTTESVLPPITTTTTTTTDPPTTTTVSSANLPSITSDSSSLSLPPLFRTPTPQVPPHAGAPYLQPTSIPDGSIFIGVGGALGLFGLIIFLWRVLVAWSINRSVRRAATRPDLSDTTPALLNKRRSGVYPQFAPGASMSMEKMGNSGARLSGLPPRTHTPNSSLFFSPTAGAGLHTSGNRGSSYLPAGYYATGSTTAPGQSIGLSPLGPQTQGYPRTRSTGGTTPPASPSLAPTSRGGGHEQGFPSTSSVNLSVAPQGRAPSAYLEDLFENHPPSQ
ncbi:uncharacterized protein BDCG_07003 [Blastomyces dermatitidis ER-3]|uniref:Transmembrane protein n=1 Tax=Ajellomyces dermatitidis (strain ER-3 / ATCC MYA-2586) TaxID=559297 RepID=A0ABM9YJ19_AJEDR|nr:uncharacterized protein BDCG_07003 [Blastomyces dermatitidis ER-3]EEQ91883.1 hypothetical protein BDCG_07003 [Blastomyces dermatitidis ER-3]